MYAVQEWEQKAKQDMRTAANSIGHTIAQGDKPAVSIWLTLAHGLKAAGYSLGSRQDSNVDGIGNLKLMTLLCVTEIGNLKSSSSDTKQGIWVL